MEVSARLVADVAHVARNHITIIRSYLEILHSESGEALDDEQLAFLGAAYDNVLQLGALIEDLVLIGALETGIAELEWTTFVVDDLLEEMIHELAPHARGEGVRLARDLDPNAGPVLADRDKLADAVRRLLDNAIRFTPAGGAVTLGLHRVGNGVEISVADNGVGMSDDELDRAFDLMTQLHREPGEPRRGHGLGLPAARHIVNAMGGVLAAVSTVGEGSRFSIRLPEAGASAKR